MRLSRISQSTSGKLCLEGVDVIISCCGYEERCTSLMDYYSQTLKEIKTKKVLVFNEPQCDTLHKNKKMFENFGFLLVDVSPKEQFISRLNVLEQLFVDIEFMERMTFLIDYSSMNREWYSSILLYLNHFSNDICKELECRFYYQIPKYTNMKDENFAFSSIRPLNGFAWFSLPDKPLALIVGLGSEEKALNGIWQYADVDPDYVHYFYTNNEHFFNLSNKYKELFDRINETNKHEYQLDRLVPLFNSLCDLYILLSETNRVAIISCGPKPFTLMSLAFAKLYNVDVWKLETNVSDHPVVKESSGESILISFVYKGK